LKHAVAGEQMTLTLNRELDELTYISELIGSDVTWEDYCPS